MIDIIIPTMWMSKGFEEALELYANNNLISRIIIIDNNRANRPKFNVLAHHKINLITYGRNIYVNPAWNEGVALATANTAGEPPNRVSFHACHCDPKNRHSCKQMSSPAKARNGPNGKGSWARNDWPT